MIFGHIQYALNQPTNQDDLNLSSLSPVSKQPAVGAEMNTRMLSNEIPPRTADEGGVTPERGGEEVGEKISFLASSDY